MPRNVLLMIADDWSPIAMVIRLCIRRTSTVWLEVDYQDGRLPGYRDRH